MDKQKIWNAVDKVVDYASDNKEKLIAAGSVIYCGYKAMDRITGKMARIKRANEDRYHREYEVYDRSAGLYLQLRRPMTSYEQYEYSMRTRRGESPAKILSEFGLLDRRKSKRKVNSKLWRL